jgi:uncharacterized Zn finger protein
VDGNSGVYQTEASLRKSTECSCTCLSEYFPCKHVVALRLTFRARPKSFVDLGGELKKIGNEEKSQLLQLIREMATLAPASLTALGIKGFEPPKDEDEEGYGDDFPMSLPFRR